MPQDPTPIMASTPTNIQCQQRDLNTLYAWIARVESHYQFTSTFLRSHIIPRGLTINVHPCVPKSPGRELAACLHKQWAQIIRRASKGFLAALKTYHRSCIQQLRLQATNLESSIAAQLGRGMSRNVQRDHQTSLRQMRLPSTGTA